MQVMGMVLVTLGLACCGVLGLALALLLRRIGGGGSSASQLEGV